MRRARIILVCCVVAVALLLTWRAASSRLSQSSHVIRQTLRSAVTNPVEFAKERLTGGIGVNLRNDAVITFVVPGSPADRAGLRAGDLITKVDGRPTTNLPLPQLKEAVTGFAGARLLLTVQRGTTNVESTIERSSWHALRMGRFKHNE